MADDLNTHGVLMTSGRHKGERITRVPVSYLKWMVNSGHSEAGYASSELARRGTSTPDLDISGHAIDSASLRCRSVWHETKLSDQEGLHAWMARMAAEALALDDKDPAGRFKHAGILWAFDMDGCWPVLKTVMREKRRESDGRRK